jgi:ATP-dependent DNA helicase PIF1
MMQDSSSNTLFDHVRAFVAYTNQNIFLTGKAGTGKTTLLKYIKEHSTKKMAIVAPTGVAAMNAKGTTINSFFQLPPGSFFPGDITMENLQAGILSISSVVSNLTYNREKRNLFRELELLVIDEISMVRCDLLDVIDALLRESRNNNAPFGGVQLLLIGDLYQLPPVTKREDWAFLSKAYASPYFFDAQVIRRNPVLQVELTRVFRQTEPEFIEILNDIRNNKISLESLEILNRRCDPQYKATDGISPIIITSHNTEAKAINADKLSELSGPEYTFEGEVSGEFRDLNIQAEQSLKLKEGAQIMFIKNDTGENRRFYNGKIGKVKSIAGSEIYISFPQEEDMLLEKSSWQSFEYKSDPSQLIVQQQVGEFFQYPIKLAWAVTIHKSQGLTFDKAVIDAGKSFVSGQVYVALSRVRTLNGLILKSKIGTDSLRSSPAVINYMNPVAEEELATKLISAEEKYILQLVLDHFSFERLLNELQKIQDNAELHKAGIAGFSTFLSDLNTAIRNLVTLSDRFKNQVLQIQEQSGLQQQDLMQSRIESAVTYFSKEITMQLLNPVNKNIRIKPKNKLQIQVQHLLLEYRQVVEHLLRQMQHAVTLLKNPIARADYATWIDEQKARRDIKDSAVLSASSTPLQLF